MKRNNLSVRAVTSVGQQLPANREEKREIFRNHFFCLKSGVQISQIVNMDEVVVTFDIPSTRP